MNKDPEKIPVEMKDPSEGLASSLQAMEMHYWFWDISLRQLSVSPETMALLGYDEKEFDVGTPTFERNIHPDDIETMYSLFEGLLEGKSEVLEIEFRLRTGDAWTWYYVRGAILRRSEDGTPGLVGGLLMDISSRYNRLIARAEEGSKFEFIFRNTREAVLILTFSDEGDFGRILEANEAAERIFGGKLQGKDPYDLLSSEYR